MDNIWCVTLFLAEKIIKNGGDASREAMTFIKNKEGALYTSGKKGACWRAYRFIEDALSIDAAQSEADFYNASYAFGTFQYLLLAPKTVPAPMKEKETAKESVKSNIVIFFFFMINSSFRL